MLATYKSQSIQHSIIHTSLLKVHTRSINHIIDDGLIDLPDLLVRHICEYDCLGSWISYTGLVLQWQYVVYYKVESGCLMSRSQRTNDSSLYYAGL